MIIQAQRIDSGHKPVGRDIENIGLAIIGPYRVFWMIIFALSTGVSVENEISEVPLELSRNVHVDLARG